MEHKVSGHAIVSETPRQVRELDFEDLALFSCDVSTICDALQATMLEWVREGTKTVVSRLVSNMVTYIDIHGIHDCIVFCESETHKLYVATSSHGNKAIVQPDYSEKAIAFAGEHEGHSYIFVLDVK